MNNSDGEILNENPHDDDNKTNEEYAQCEGSAITDFNIVDTLVNQYHLAKKEMVLIKTTCYGGTLEDIRETKEYFLKHLRRNEDEFLEKLVEVIESAKYSYDSELLDLLAKCSPAQGDQSMYKNWCGVLKLTNRKLYRLLKLDKELLKKMISDASPRIYC